MRWRKFKSWRRPVQTGRPWGLVGRFVIRPVFLMPYFILAAGQIQTVIKKHILPNDDVFDEKRLYQSADISGPYRVGNLRIGTPICEDAWHADVPEALAESGAEVLFVPNGSPYARGKMDVRMGHMVARVVETGLPLVYVNMVGGQDDQVFDGGSFVLNPGGALAVSLPMFETGLAHVDFELTGQGWRAVAGPRAHWPDALEQDYHAMVLSLRDYMRKTGFSSAVLGLSGGIDSAIVATIAADALGPQNVHCVMLPSEFTSQASLQRCRLCGASAGRAFANLAHHRPASGDYGEFGANFCRPARGFNGGEYPISSAWPVVDVSVQ